MSLADQPATLSRAEVQLAWLSAASRSERWAEVHLGQATDDPQHWTVTRRAWPAEVDTENKQREHSVTELDLKSQRQTTRTVTLGELLDVQRGLRVYAASVSTPQIRRAQDHTRVGLHMDQHLGGLTLQRDWQGHRVVVGGAGLTLAGLGLGSIITNWTLSLTGWPIEAAWPWLLWLNLGGSLSLGLVTAQTRARTLLGTGQAQQELRQLDEDSFKEILELFSAERTAALLRGEPPAEDLEAFVRSSPSRPRQWAEAPGWMKRLARQQWTTPLGLLSGPLGWSGLLMRPKSPPSTDDLVISQVMTRVTATARPAVALQSTPLSEQQLAQLRSIVSPRSAEEHALSRRWHQDDQLVTEVNSWIERVARQAFGSATSSLPAAPVNEPRTQKTRPPRLTQALRAMRTLNPETVTGQAAAPEAIQQAPVQQVPVQQAPVQPAAQGFSNPQLRTQDLPLSPESHWALALLEAQERPAEQGTVRALAAQRCEADLAGTEEDLRRIGAHLRLAAQAADERVTRAQWNGWTAVLQQRVSLKPQQTLMASGAGPSNERTPAEAAPAQLSTYRRFEPELIRIDQIRRQPQKTHTTRTLSDKGR